MTERLGYVSSYDQHARRPKVGSVWVWELGSPHARALIQVTEVKWNGEEWWVTTDTLLDSGEFPSKKICYNDLGRFWEACVPVDDSTMAVMFNSET